MARFAVCRCSIVTYALTNEILVYVYTAVKTQTRDCLKQSLSFSGAMVRHGKGHSVKKG